MTVLQAIEVIRNETKCVERATKGCSRNCNMCDLVLPDKDILDAYDMAVEVLLEKGDDGK